MASNWYIEEEEDEGHSRTIDDTLQKGLVLVQEHEATLRSIEDAVGDTVGSLPNEYFLPVSVNLNPQERVLALELIQTEEHFLKKVLAVFAYLCDEIFELNEIAESKFFPTLLTFGVPLATQTDDEELPPGVAEEQMGRLLPLFQELSNFVNRCHDCAVNLVQQLAQLYNQRELLYQRTFKFVRLVPVFQSLAQLLRLLVTLDAIIVQNEYIVPAWNEYKRMMQFVRAEPDKYGVTDAQVQKFERLLVHLDQSVMRGATFAACIDMDFQEMVPVDDEGGAGAEPEVVNVRNNPHLLEELFSAVKSMLEACTHVTERKDLVDIFALYVLYRRLTPAYAEPDAKFYKRLWQVQVKVPIVVLCGKLVWFPSDFLEEFARLEVKNLVPKDVAAARKSFVDKFDDSFPNTVHKIHLQVTGWMVDVENIFTSSARHLGAPVDLLETRGELLHQGLIHTHGLSVLMHTLLAMHLALGVPMQRRVLRPLSMCTELLKAIEFLVLRKAAVISESMPHVLRLLSLRLLRVVRPIQTKLKASHKVDHHKLDMLAATHVVETVLLGSDSFTFTRQTVLALGLHICLNAHGLVKEAEAEAALEVLKRLQGLASWQSSMRDACSCSFLMWNQDLFRTFVEDLYRLPSEANRLQYVCAAFADAGALLRSVQHEADNEAHTRAFKKFMLDTLEQALVAPLCRDVENDLRLRIHAKTSATIKRDAFNPKTVATKALRPFLELRPLRIFGSLVDVRQKVTHYLETIFYNLTTVALYDWLTYADMRNLAAEKFGLEMSDNHLPMGSLEYDQGLDVLMIMRNIHVFVGRFSYNLNQQNFVERRPDRGSKNLNTINIQSIAASLRQHGLGILNTTVNFTYQFLAQKFHIFRQFLFDPYIEGRLSKQRRWFRKHKAECKNMFPYERALNFCKEIRKLGTPNGRTYLDEFRILITEIGNALGYVRMVRSAGMHFCSEAVRFLPDLEQIINFEAHTGAGSSGDGEGGEPAAEDGAADATGAVEGANLSAETVRAAKNLDDVVGTLVRNFSEGSDYFKVLVSVFQQVLFKGDHAHLDNFYVIIPSLCLSWVDSSLQAKNMMYKANRSRDAYYTDDGFAVGVAYILAILKQDAKFDSLHWFQCMRQKLEADSHALEQKKAEREKLRSEKHKSQRSGLFSRSNKEEAPTEEDEEAVHTMQLSERRLQATRRENELLYFSLSGSRIFFKR